MKSAVVVFPGSNCDRDMAEALRLVTGQAPAMVWHRETELPPGLDLIAIPGGFSYGDYLRSGAMAAQSPVMRAVKAAADRGVFVLGVCNGFQVLTEARLLPGALMRNAGIAFIGRDVAINVENSQSEMKRTANSNMDSYTMLARRIFNEGAIVVVGVFNVGYFAAGGFES